MIVNNKEKFPEMIMRMLIALGYTDVENCKEASVSFTAKKDGVKYAIACQYDIDAITEAKMEDFIRCVKDMRDVVPVFVTNSSFSSSAKKLGDASGVQLWDRNFVDRMSIGVDVEYDDKEEGRKSGRKKIIIGIVVAVAVVALVAFAAWYYAPMPL